ncbi:hypothetical protein ACFWFF_40815, partial [Streptomyces sp. NPDC060223]
MDGTAGVLAAVAGGGQVFDAGGGVDAGAFERSWGKLAEGERLERALREARRLVGAGVPAPLSLDGNEPFDRISPQEQLVRRVALHLYRGETDTAHALAAAQPTPAGPGEEHATTPPPPMEDSGDAAVRADRARMAEGGHAAARRGLPGGARHGFAGTADTSTVAAVPGGEQPQPPTEGGFYDAPATTVSARWGEVRERVRGGDRIIVTVKGRDGRDGLALVPLNDLGTDHARLPTTGVKELFGGLGAAAEQVKDKERRVATFHGRRVFGVMPAAEWLAAHPGARRVPLPPPGRSADGTGTKEITASALWKDNGPLLQSVAEKDARYRVTRRGEPDLGVISEAAFQTYVSQEQPEPIHRWAGHN